jgi:hypothetical protein
VLTKLFREFSGLFWNLFSLSSSYFYLLEGSKIFLRDPNTLFGLFMTQSFSGNFPRNFWNLQNIFRGFYELSGYF